jgi:nucleotide sugar dehydrogenase
MSGSSSKGGAEYPRRYSNDIQLERKIRTGELKVAVCGLGHVGSAMASVWLRAGAHVIGIDKSSQVLNYAREGKTHLPEPGVTEAYSEGIRTGRFTVYDDLMQASHDSYLKLICVPVLSRGGTADLTSLKEVASEVGKGLKKGDVVSVNPSVPPGTTEGIICKILEDKSSGLSVDSDFSLLYNPERIYEGRAIEDIEERYPAIIAGAGPNSTRVGKELYSLIFKKGVLVLSSIKAAEAEKLFEGVYRDVNIALANELAKLCEKIGVNFWEAREAANSQPFCNLHKPGVGVGGACIPVYPQFVIDTARRLGVQCEITAQSRAINNSMPAYCVNEAVCLLEERSKKSISGAIVTLLGLSFRGGVSDTRLSPTYDVIDEFLNHKVGEIRIHDPLVAMDSRLSSYPVRVRLTTDIHNAIQDTDLVFLVADHQEYRLLNQKKLRGVPVYDGRGILRKTNLFDTSLRTIGVAHRPLPAKPTLS